MSTYPFRQGIDYGPRDGSLGLEFHMTEGNGGYGDVVYLMRRSDETVEQWHARVSGVSAHVVIIADGTTYQMVDFSHCNGNLNPADRAAEYGYYGHSTLVEVLGDHWPDPNQWSLSAEIAGKRADGPTDAQVRAAITWGLDMRVRFPTLRGAYGHHDQSTKACPGLTTNMKAIFTGVGGHGLWEETMGLALSLPATPLSGLLVIPLGTKSLRVRDKGAYATTAAATRPAYVVETVSGTRGYLVDLDGDEAHLIYAGTPGIRFTPTVRPPDPTELADAMTAGRESFRRDVNELP